MKSLILICFIFLIGMKPAYSARLADSEELKRQLLSVDTGSNDFYLENIYPVILSQAGRKTQSIRLAMLFEFAQAELLKSVTSDREGAQTLLRQYQTSFHKFTPQLIKAILPQDPREADDAILIYNSMGGAFLRSSL